jgi:xanthine dehydrogenase accessory factor
MDRLLEIARQWRRHGRRAMVVEVSATRGSVPREAGTRMLVDEHEARGTIGGGHLELQAIATARQRLAAGVAEPLDQQVALGPTLGQCCGGMLTLRLAPLTDAALQHWPEPKPRFHLQIYGAGHVGRAIVRHLESIDCRVQWIDERDSEFPALSPPPHIERVCVEPVEAEVASAPAQAFYLVLTHSHDLDLRITQAILQRGDFAYLGLIGSRTKRARFEHRFLQRGVAAERIARITCPIGVAGIAGKEPEVIAVAVVAQLLQQQPG